jgi:hypothetical protein
VIGFHSTIVPVMVDGPIGTALQPALIGAGTPAQFSLIRHLARHMAGTSKAHSRPRIAFVTAPCRLIHGVSI